MYLCLLVFLILILFMVLHAGHLKREYFKFGDKKLGLRIALLSDLHMGLLMVSEKDIKRAIHEEKPDLLVIAGDIIENEKHIGDFRKLIEKINPQCPVFVTFGNHDHGCFNKNPRAKELFFFNLQSLGIEFLINDCVVFYKGQRAINIVGIDDYRNGKPNIQQALMKKEKNADFTVAVSHNPEIALSIPQKEVDLLLCGHFHGGQIWMPFHLEYRLLRNEKTCKAGYRKGFHNINGTPCYISRGIGNVLIPLRLGSLPEITFIDI
ncbi:MAG: metallophosphoesterase [Clostridiaceae bacterium]|nr:metallophosphoesterase [Clostridiaceae bacterium]